MRVGILFAIALLAFLLVTPAPAAGPLFAVAPPDKEGKHDAGHDGEQLDLFKGGIELTIWSIVVFLILFFLLSKFAWPHIREGLDRREMAIARDRHEADLARKEAAELRRQLQEEAAKANEQIRQTMDRARVDAQQLVENEMARGRAELAAERERLQRELRISTDDALHRIWGQAADLATLISTKAVRKQLREEDHRALVDEALAEFRRAAEGRREDIEGARA